MSEITATLNTLVRDMSSSDYHGMKNTFSSSQLKDLLDDPEYFYKKYVAKTIDRQEIPAFDIGTYFHTAILEPDKLNDECAVYTGIRRGKDWDQFKAENAGKAIITESEMTQALGLIKAVQDSPIAMNRIKRGEPEVSAFVELAVDGSDIYAPEFGVELGKFGWTSTKSKPSKSAIKLVIKTRADLLAEDYILDLKSTTGNAKSAALMRKKISDYQYDLSAALYLDVFSLAKGKQLSQFLWVFASKDYFNSKTYMASADNILIGRAKWKKAAITLADCLANNWQFEDSMGILEPNIWETEWIKDKAENYL
jgi:exodeoxyribonuclease VIII